MDIVVYVICGFILIFYLSYIIYEIHGLYKRYHAVTGKGFLKLLFSSDCFCSVFFTDENYEKLKKLSKDTGLSIDLFLNYVVSSLEDSEEK